MTAGYRTTLRNKRAKACAHGLRAKVRYCALPPPIKVPAGGA